MAFHRDFDGSDPTRSDATGRAAEARQHRRIAADGRLATGTLACPECDAPVALGGVSVSPADPLGCPFCGREGAVREFLSLRRPTRPTRVVLRVVARGRRGARAADRG